MFSIFSKKYKLWSEDFSPTGAILVMFGCDILMVSAPFLGDVSMHCQRAKDRYSIIQQDLVLIHSEILFRQPHHNTLNGMNL